MPLIALASLKASPGVTTTALALAAAWPAQRLLLIEADPAGGDLGPWLGLPPSPGLASLATAARRDHDRGETWRHATELGAGVHVIVAPAGAEQAAACLATLDGTEVLGSLVTEPDVVIADCGRLDPGSPSLALAAQATITLLLVRPKVSELSHLAPRISRLTQAGLRLGLVLAPDTGQPPDEPSYGAAEIADTLSLPVYGSLPADPRTVGYLLRNRAELPDARRPPALVRAVAGLATDLSEPAQPPLGSLASKRPDTDPDHLREVTAGDRNG